MSYNPYAPQYPRFGGDPGYSSTGGTAAAAPGYSSVGQVDAANAAYQQWLSSPLGQAQDTAAESAAAYARQQADADMANKKRALDIQVAQLKQQGRNQEAQIALQRGDQQISRDRLAQELKIHQDQFGLDQQKFGLQQQQFGLDRANAYTKYASTPDQRFQASDFADAMDRIGQGLGVRPYGTTAGDPTPKTWNDFTALSAYPGAGAAGSSSAGGSSMLGSGQMGASPDAGGGGATGSTTDPRITASTAVMKAIPPSDSAGHDISDQAALSAIQNIYKAGRPGALQRMLPGQQQQFGAGLSRLGYNAPDALAQMNRQGIGQGSGAGANAY
jgi:hypothetical protein